jgi:ABC-type sugar transport system ATPase subunit
MRAGAVEQFGTPEDVYARPATAYVAQFIGHPQVEILPAILKSSGSDHYAVCGEAHFRLNAQQAAALSRFKNGFQMTVRPEHVHLSDDGIPAVVKDVQPVGPSTSVLLEWNGGAMVARLSGIIRLTPGSKVHASVDTNNLMFFEADTGRRIETGA